MTETLIVLIAAHCLADFALQTSWMVAHKNRPGVMALHMAIVVATAALLAGSLAVWPLALLAASHLALDAWKQYLTHKGLRAFVLDQIGHLASLVVIAWLFPHFVDDGVWFYPAGRLPDWVPQIEPNHYLAALILITGALVTIRVGGMVIRLFFDRFGSSPDQGIGLPGGGLHIGLLERSLIFFLVLIGRIEAVGFLIAAKSVLRFGVVAERQASEYVIIGTLFSFTWALVAAWLTARALELAI